MKKLLCFLLAVTLLVTLIGCTKKDGDLELRTYSYGSKSDPTSQSSITFHEDKKFTFIFSPLSSYIGEGTYVLNGNSLLLKTDDGKYHYTFKIVDNTLVFDAKKSSDMIWFAKFSNGSIFK